MLASNPPPLQPMFLPHPLHGNPFPGIFAPISLYLFNVMNLMAESEYIIPYLRATVVYILAHLFQAYCIVYILAHLFQAYCIVYILPFLFRVYCTVYILTY